MSICLAARTDGPTPPRVGELVDSTRWRGQRGALAARLEREGYVLLRGALDAEAVRRARGEVMGRLAAVGEVAEPAIEGVPTGASRREALEPDRGAFWRSVCEGPALRAVTHRGTLGAIAAEILGEAAIPFDFLWLRAMVGGRATPLHFDHSYMNRGSARVLTAWVPLGDVPVAAGPIVVVENSHRFDDLIARHRGRDVDRDEGYSGSLPGDAFGFAAERGARLLTADFRAGDVLIFGMFTLHGSLPNTYGRVRLSCDVRWQPAGEPRDDRWFGAPPPGHGGTGYGGVNGARPLGSDGIRR
ncbi:MAG: phytanoyl-CoA dioxygenase family protein [Alphaproteobacteria bacterium]|nr:phytanoyl-CoA dioxygenase family protein [Alphaproteobacteria bacterium]